MCGFSLTAQRRLGLFDDVIVLVHMGLVVGHHLAGQLVEVLRVDAIGLGLLRPTRPGVALLHHVGLADALPFRRFVQGVDLLPRQARVPLGDPAVLDVDRTAALPLAVLALVTTDGNPSTFRGGVVDRQLVAPVFLNAKVDLGDFPFLV